MPADRPGRLGKGFQDRGDRPDPRGGKADQLESSLAGQCYQCPD